METIELLPWNNDELERLLRELIAHGSEAAKVDFKLEIEAASQDQKAELLKDIVAIANSYDDRYGDHGFLIYGVRGKEIVGINQTEPDTDKLQNHVDQLLRSYISPMPQVCITSFLGPTGQRWGALVIPPRNSKPHMFVRDLQCSDPRRTRRKGEWFVRRGTTTDVGLPEDLHLIVQRQIELLLRPLHDSIHFLQARVAQIEEQYNSALFGLAKRAIAGLSGESPPLSGEREEISSGISQSLGMDLATRFRQRLRTPEDILAKELIGEAKKLREFLSGPETSLPWNPHLNNAAVNRGLVEDLEERVCVLQQAAATIILNDSGDTYVAPLLQVLRLLAVTEVPDGVRYNDAGRAMRIYPLQLIVYSVFICSVAASRGDILRKVGALRLPGGRGSNARLPITNTMFSYYHAKRFFNEVVGQSLCEPVPHRVRQVVSDRIGEMLAEQSEREFFFRGEFVLALANVDAGITDGASPRIFPVPGLYLYMYEAQEPIKDLLVEHPGWLEEAFSNPLGEVLHAFDLSYHQVVDPHCFPVFGLTTADLLSARSKANS